MLLITGEIYVDYTLPGLAKSCKLRLGGVVHAARGAWAADVVYSVAAFCPGYLVAQAEHYLRNHGCSDFVWLGDVVGAPNLVIIGDATEVSDQKYEDLLREEKCVVFNDVGSRLVPFENVLVFPGRFDLKALRTLFSDSALFSFDIAYGVEDLSVLSDFIGGIRALIISTSSALFADEGAMDVSLLSSKMKSLGAEVFLLKENRGGSRLFDLRHGSVESIPAVLGQTANSVGVGDVYSAVMLGFADEGWEYAAWRGASAATFYSQTTYPDDFKRGVQRSLKLPLSLLRTMGGTILPWHARQDYSIYFAAPDFAYFERETLDSVIKALNYHNFRLRRPIEENGELPSQSDMASLQATYSKDYDLLQECDAVFAVPLERDPGTLVEIGIAIALNKPIITYDPKAENKNTMVIAGSTHYSQDLDECLNGLFDVLSKLLRNQI